MFSTSLNGILLPVCIYNASGTRCTTTEELLALYNNPWTGAVLTKSCTLESRLGNPEPRYADNANGSINSNGLCNQGYKAYCCNQTFNKTKPYIISVAGPTLTETLEIMHHIEDTHQNTIVELNRTCPNIDNKSDETLYEYLRQVTEIYTGYVGLKLEPIWYPEQIRDVSHVINEFKIGAYFLLLPTKN